MGKAAMCLRLLQVLDSGQVYKSSELAEILGTKQRNIVEYRRELQKIGCHIESIPGKNGGIKLDKSFKATSLLSDDEQDALFNCLQHIESSPDFPEKERFVSAILTITSSICKH